MLMMSLVNVIRVSQFVELFCDSPVFCYQEAPDHTGWLALCGHVACGEACRNVKCHQVPLYS